MLARVRKLLGTRRSDAAGFEERMRSVVDHIVDGVITIDASGIVQTFNRAAERIFGYKQAEIVGRNVSTLMPEPDASRHNSYISNYLATGKAKIIGIGREVMGRRSDGAMFPMELAISEFHLGERRLFTGIVRDITERKQLEQELHQRLKQLAEADQRKDQFIGMLGHELRNPLAPLSNGLQILRRCLTFTDASVESTVGMMERQIAQMVRLIDDLLDVSRIASGKIELRRTTVDLVSIVDQAIDVIHGDIEARRQHILVTHAQEHLLINADAARIGQIVTNLVTNASKYSDASGSITVSTQQVGERAELRVKDNGVGIPADKLEAIFDIFVQIESSLERRRGGLGLGLSLVKSLAELHGGFVVAQSDGLGKGSEFVVDLPLLAERRGAHAAAKHSAANFRKCRVLVIDDNTDSADSLAALIRVMGHEVVTLYSGDAVVEEVARHVPDVVVCDIGMPGISGLDVARQLRAVFKDRPLKLIAATGYARPEDVASARAAGFDLHLVKPVDLSRVEAAISGMTIAQDAARGSVRHIDC